MAQRGNIVIIAEKPSVARDIARVAGAFQSTDGFFSGNRYSVTWAIGHLVTLPEPQQINPDWKYWNFNFLPMIPDSWPLVAVEKTKTQFTIVKKLLNHCDEIICATDAGREGELIFRYIYELSKSKKPVKRLWISSLTDDAIRLGLQNLKSSSFYDSLADSARARSRADWIVGMNLSRAYAISTNENLFVGRVQTPTLAMIVERDLKIKNFVPENYKIIEAKFKTENGSFTGVYIGEKNPLSQSEIEIKEIRFRNDSKEVENVLNRTRSAEATVLNLTGKSVQQPAPLLYDLTELQRHCNRLFGFSATQTLEIAQTLYEKYKLISYPRTGSRHVSQSVAETLPEIVKNIVTPFSKEVHKSTGVKKLSKRFVDDTKVTDHHAIIPTLISPKDSNSKSRLSDLEFKVYDLICRRLLMAWHDDFETKITTVISLVGKTDLFKSQGTMVVNEGWKKLDLKTKSNGSEYGLPLGLQPGTNLHVEKIESIQKTTEPPPHLTEATLLSGMESAGRHLEDRELAEYMNDTGLGTPATRAGIIEILLARNYIERKNKSLVATPLGEKLIATVHSSVKSPELTARWEKKLNEIKDHQTTLKSFMTELQNEVSELIEEIRNTSFVKSYDLKSSLDIKNTNSTDPALNQLAMARPRRTATSPKNLQPLLKQVFGFDQFRPSQEAVCKSVTEGSDVLLVMPTGAGKSICYQLPGIARAGTTLVISPLVALIEDQVAKLKSLNITAERIHSGRSRQDSRNVCHQYLAGSLDFLFIAPERLSVPGFLEFLNKRPLSLIAIDEAHCISQWGHDFRPDYRILGERLKELKPAPIVALTATATPTVQDDICKQLGLTNEKRFIQGFRRTNISIEIAEFTPKDRPSIISLLLKRSGRLPAIVYAPTRKKAEELTEKLSGAFRVGSYHAGMSATARESIQTQFLENKIEVMIATVAFGMGIDKPNIRTVIHAAMPGSIEGYYQEIGRAGRDGLPSTAYLLHSYADQKTHEFFLEMNYPDTNHLREIFKKLTPKKITKATVKKTLTDMDSDIFDRALEQLWVHKGVLIDPDESMSVGHANWERSYNLQRELKQNQIKQMLSLTSSGKCRMIYMVSHFGDRGDSGRPCGSCDICNPTQSTSLEKKRPLSNIEKKAVTTILSQLSIHSGVSQGKIFQNLDNTNYKLPRADFETIMALFERKGWIESKETSFEKDGKEIHYRSIFLKAAATNITIEELNLLQISSRPIADLGKKRMRKEKPKKTNWQTIDFEKPLSAESNAIATRLKEWRLVQAKKNRIPAFRILTDKTLIAIAEKKPKSMGSLLEITSINRRTLIQYGEDVLRIIRRNQKISRLDDDINL